MHHLLCFPTRRSSDLERQLHRVDTPALRELLRRFAAEEGDPVDRLGQGEAGAGDDRGMRPGVVEERVLYAVGVVYRQITGGERDEPHERTCPDRKPESGKGL